MKNIFKYLIKLFLAGYFSISIFSLNNCTNAKNEELSYYSYKQSNIDTAKKLLYDYKAQLFDCNNINEALNKSVLLDSTIINSQNNGDYGFLKTVVNNSCGRKIYAYLKCSKEQLNHYSQFISNHAFVVAKINKIDSIKTIAEADSLGDKTIYIKGNNSILLTAECLALQEIPIYNY